MREPDRVFIAVRPPREACDDLSETAARLNISRSVLDPAGWHITIAFMGEVAIDRRAATEAALSSAAAGSVAPRLRLQGGGSFGKTVLWAGIGGDLARLDSLVGRVREELDARGLPFDDRPFQPHLTIARPRHETGDDTLAADLSTLDSYCGPHWVADRLVLYRVTPDSGCRYQELAAALLH